MNLAGISHDSHFLGWTSPEFDRPSNNAVGDYREGPNTDQRHKIAVTAAQAMTLLSCINARSICLRIQKFNAFISNRRSLASPAIYAANVWRQHYPSLSLRPRQSILPRAEPVTSESLRGSSNDCEMYA